MLTNEHKYERENWRPNTQRAEMLLKCRIAQQYIVNGMDTRDEKCMDAKRGRVQSNVDNNDVGARNAVSHKDETVIQNMNCNDMRVTEAITTGTGGH